MQLNLGKMVLAGCLMFGLVACPAPPAPTPDFGLTLGSPSLSVKQAESGTISVSLNKTNGFTGSVALTLEGAPAGVIGSFNPASTTSTSILTLNVAANAALGNTTLTVKGVSGALTKTSTFDLTVTAATPGVTSVTISAPATTVLPATNTTLTANVTGIAPFNNAVTWSIVSGDGASLINPTGSSITFSVPGAFSTERTVEVKATSTADSTKFGTITMTIKPASITGVTLTAVKSALKTGESTQLSATVTSSGNINQFNSLSTWKIEDDGIGTLSSGNGSLLSTGFGTTNTYFAPSASVGRIVRITATSVQDPTQKKTIFISINPNQASISGGQFFSLGLKPDGTVLSWGRATNGELGSNSNLTRDTPDAIIQDSSSDVKPIVALSAGGFHALALKNDGTMLAWGDNVYGQLGTGFLGAANSKFVAVDVRTTVASERFSAIAAGTTHSLALRTNGVVVGWGDGRKKQLGSNLDLATVPTDVIGTNDIVAIAAGVAHSLALKSDGTVLAWGDDEFGQLGNDAASLASFSPVVVSGATNIVAIAAGGNHSLALKSDGTLLAWGANFSGQLGNDDPNFSDKFTPVAVAGSNSNNIVAIAGGLNHSLALKKDGTVLAWGSDEKGQLGDGTPLTDKTTPTPVLGASDIVAIAAGGLHSLALKQNGTMQSWGEDEKEQLGNGATTGNQASVVDVLLGALTIRLP